MGGPPPDRRRGDRLAPLSRRTQKKERLPPERSFFSFSGPIRAAPDGDEGLVAGGAACRPRETWGIADPRR